MKGNFRRRPSKPWFDRVAFKFPALVLWAAILIEILRHI